MMNHLFLTLPIVLPVVFWAAYHLHVDRQLPEPLGYLLLTFALGIGSFFIGMLMYQALGAVGLRRDAFGLAENDLPGLFTYAVLAIGLIEESAKLIPFLLIVLRFREFNEPIDGIVYASFLALGFAAMENQLYLPELATRAAYARGFAGPVVHMVFASIWGYYIGRAWLRRRALAATVIVSLGVTACLHGAYDFVVIGMPEPGLPLAATIITGLWIWRLVLIRDLHETFQRQRRYG